MMIFFERDHLLVLPHMEVRLHRTGELWWQVTERESPDSFEPSGAEAQLCTGTTAQTPRGFLSDYQLYFLRLVTST